jgi:putative toxin-antitoxin system antitoxin component (TIGR02293 family)
MEADCHGGDAVPELIELAESTPGAGFYGRLQSKLGVPGIHSDKDLVALVENRLPAAAVRSLVRAGLSDSEAYQLIVPRRTLAHRIARREPLSREESDKAVRVARITALAEEAFGDPDRAWRWLRKTKRRFGGRKPIELLATEAGARLVEELIGQIDDGMAA